MPCACQNRRQTFEVVPNAGTATRTGNSAASATLQIKMPTRGNKLPIQRRRIASPKIGRTCPDPAPPAARWFRFSHFSRPCRSR